MKYLKKFNESIVDYDTENIRSFYNELSEIVKKKRIVTFQELVESGNRNDIEVVNYETFYNELPTDKIREDAPPKDISAFGLVNPNTHKARLVVNVPAMDKGLLDFCYHMLKHENIHVGQMSRKKDKSKGEFLGDMSNRKAYFSNKDEVMAFSQSISDMIMGNKPKSVKDGISMLKSIPLYNSIKKYVDKDILNRYNKYIFLYLEKEFEKKPIEGTDLQAEYDKYDSLWEEAYKKGDITSAKKYNDILKELRVKINLSS